MKKSLMKNLSPGVVATLLFCMNVNAQTATELNCAGCVGPADIAASAVTAPKIANGAVGALKLANGSVTVAKIADSSVSTSKIANGAITNLKMAAASVDSSKIKNGTVAAEDLSSTLVERLNGAVVLLTTQASLSAASLFTAAQCPADRIPISASCSCESYGGVLNYGTLSTCSMTSTGAMAGCLIDALTYNPSKAFPEANVAAICLGATRSDGLPWLPVTTTVQTNNNGPTSLQNKVPDHYSAVAQMEEQMAKYKQALSQASRANQ